MLVKIFVDGSYYPETDTGAYCAVITDGSNNWNNNGQSTMIVGLEQLTNSFRMEFTAILKAVEKLNKLYSKACTVEIYTDVDGIVMAGTRFFQEGKKPKRHRTMWNRLFELLRQNNHDVKFLLVNRDCPEYKLCHQTAKQMAKSIVKK